MLQNINVILGDIKESITAKSFRVFDERVINFLDEVSDAVLKNPDSKKYKDLISIAFFFRKGSLQKIKQNYNDENRVGVGLAFHITPSNVPMQFFYSLAVSLLAGNANIVRLPSREYEQSAILLDIMKDKMKNHEEMQNRICLVKYGHEKENTDYFSSYCDVRIIWGGDESIRQVRLSPLSARSYDVTFADRFSISLVNALAFLKSDAKMDIIKKFYIDTYFSDQNACNSTRMVVWNGDNEHICEAKKFFWQLLAELAESEYDLKGISVVEKFISGCALAIDKEAVYDRENSYKNYMNVINITSLPEDITLYKGNCGLFLQYEINDIEQLIPFIRKEWQTMTYFGEDREELVYKIQESGIKGIDRVVPIGKSGDPSTIWDGIDFIERLSRKIYSL